MRARACTGACMYVYEELLPPTSISNIVLIDVATFIFTHRPN